MNRTAAALISGLGAILINTVALAAADLVPLTTARGGLLRLIVILADGALKPPAGGAFQTGFHIIFGVMMALFYAFALDSLLKGPRWFRGLIYAALVWLANAMILLPLIGEGFAGSRFLTFAGMAWFAAAHTLFFVLQAVIYGRLVGRTA